LARVLVELVQAVKEATEETASLLLPAVLNTAAEVAVELPELVLMEPLQHQVQVVQQLQLIQVLQLLLQPALAVLTPEAVAVVEVVQVEAQEPEAEAEQLLLQEETQLATQVQAAAAQATLTLSAAVMAAQVLSLLDT
jgi:hypothetical protein